MKTIFAVIFMMLSAVANAQLSIHAAAAAGFDKLPEAEKARIIQEITNASSNNLPIVGNVTPEALDRFATTGAGIGKGLAAAAKELGVAVNEFSSTPVGMLTVGLIVWHVLGDQLVAIFAGIMVWIIGFAALRFIVNRVAPMVVKFDEEKTNIFGNRVVVERYRPELSTEMTATMVVGCAAVLVLGMLVIVNG